MTVAELIAALGRLDPVTQVLTSDCCHGLSTATLVEVDAVLVDDTSIRSAEYAWDWAENTFDDWEPGNLVQAVVIR